MNISDERLDELLGLKPMTSPVGQDVNRALRELLAYRKAVKEWIAAVDAAAAHEKTDMVANDAGWFARRATLAVSVRAAEATLRTLGEM